MRYASKHRGIHYFHHLLRFFHLKTRHSSKVCLSMSATLLLMISASRYYIYDLLLRRSPFLPANQLTSMMLMASLLQCGLIVPTKHSRQGNGWVRIYFAGLWVYVHAQWPFKNKDVILVFFPHTCHVNISILSMVFDITGCTSLLVRGTTGGLKTAAELFCHV